MKRKKEEANRKRSEAMEGKINASKNSAVSADTRLFSDTKPVTRTRSELAQEAGVSSAIASKLEFILTHGDRSQREAIEQVVQLLYRASLLNFPQQLPEGRNGGVS
jgi:hypothetical protein